MGELPLNRTPGAKRTRSQDIKPLWYASCCPRVGLFEVFDRVLWAVVVGMRIVLVAVERIYQLTIPRNGVLQHCFEWGKLIQWKDSCKHFNGFIDSSPLLDCFFAQLSPRRTLRFVLHGNYNLLEQQSRALKGRINR